MRSCPALVRDAAAASSSRSSSGSTRRVRSRDGRSVVLGRLDTGLRATGAAVLTLGFLAAFRAFVAFLALRIAFLTGFRLAGRRAAFAGFRRTGLRAVRRALALFLDFFAMLPPVRRV